MNAEDWHTEGGKRSARRADSAKNVLNVRWSNVSIAPDLPYYCAGIALASTLVDGVFLVLPISAHPFTHLGWKEGITLEED